MSTTCQPIRFLLNGRVTEATDLAPTTTVLRYLREYAGRKGTKEGCAEGDCGACTVVVGELVNDEIQLRAVNACIQFLPTLDGKALFSVEDVAGPDGSLHPVQTAMIQCHASQCGFCTPGFVMSLWALYLQSPEPASEDAVRSALTGNLCRCTGYRPLIEAGRCMSNYPRVEPEWASIRTTLQSIQRPSTFEYESAEYRYCAPRTLEALVARKHQNPTATVLAGGTDIGLWVNKQFRELGEILYTGDVAELNQISITDGQITIGAAVRLAAAADALSDVYPELDEIWERFASQPIRNAGTLGGNIANGSPIGDSMPALIAIGATVTLASVRGHRELPLEKLYVGYQKKDMEADEIVGSIRIPARPGGLKLASYKVSKRYDSDISAVCAAFVMQLSEGRVAVCRIAFGGMAATPRRAHATEAALLGQPWNADNVRLAMSALATDFKPLSDMRASAEYRLTVAQNLLWCFFLEYPTAATAVQGGTQVFARSVA